MNEGALTHSGGGFCAPPKKEKEAKYIIHTKKIGKSLTYIALFRERKIGIEVKIHVTNIQSLKTDNTFFTYTYFAPIFTINTTAPGSVTSVIIPTFLLIL